MQHSETREMRYLPFSLPPTMTQKLAFYVIVGGSVCVCVCGGGFCKQISPFQTRPWGLDLMR